MNLNAFYQLSYGLYIITTVSENKINGFVSNTVMQITSNPKQLIITSNKDNLTTSMIDHSLKFGISVLSQKCSRELIGLFGYQSGKNIDKFKEISYFTSPNNLPIITEGCTAWFECQVKQRLEVNTHILYIAEITDGDIINEDEPLTYRYYHQVMKGKSPKSAPTYIAETAFKEKTDTYVCDICGYEYNSNNPSFKDLPDDWVCPICKADKSHFYKK